MSRVTTGMLRIELKRSRCLAAVFIVVHVGAAVTLWPLDLAPLGKLVLTAAIAGSLAHALWRHALLMGRGGPTALEVREHGLARVRTGAGEWLDARILETTYVSPMLTVVNLRVPGRGFTQHLVIVSDNADAESRRRLRVWLRWGYQRTR